MHVRWTILKSSVHGRCAQARVSRTAAAIRAARPPERQKWPGLLPAIFLCDDLPYRRGGAVPAGGGGSDACPPLSSGVILRMVTRRLIALGPSTGSFKYCSP